jgi:hypothetical protein
MHQRKALVPVVAATLLLNLVVVTVPASVGATTGFSRQIPSAGTTTMRSGPQGTSSAFQDPEFRGSPGEGAEEVNDRSQSHPVAPAVSLDAGAKRPKSNPDLKLDFEGLNHRNQRLANNGNQFSLEPPDQGLCVGNGFVLETVNDVLRVYNTAGQPVTGVMDQNTFYGYPPAFNRTPGATNPFGPFVTDPECIFDVATQRWFHTVLTLDIDPANGAFLGPNHIDIAVSQTADPTGVWNIWRIPVQNDGTQGTPNHHCAGGPCIGDYPHIGLDAYGLYITTNEYPFFEDGYQSANIYAISKAALAAGASTITVTQFETVGLDAGNPGFTLRPSVTPGTGFDRGAGGTEYFMSSNAAEEANGDGTSEDLLVWALTNTSSLASATPALTLSHTTLDVGAYSVPPKSNQKAGDFPLGQCINDTTMETPFGPGCWQFFFLPEDEPAHDEVISTPDSGDSRMMQVTFANGRLWGALDTGIDFDGDSQAGIEWFIVKPTTSVSGVSAVVEKSGYLGVENNNLTYPAIGVTNSGRGAMVFTMLGDDHYPSAAFAPIDAQVGVVGDITVIEEGSGPTDGFTSYKAFVGSPPRTRWGDYSAAATDGNSIWLATEYIRSTCNLATFVSGGFSCGQTRTSLGNWSTRVAKVVP